LRRVRPSREGRCDRRSRARIAGLKKPKKILDFAPILLYDNNEAPRCVSRRVMCIATPVGRLSWYVCPTSTDDRRLVTSPEM
jgi:hypothetical protein